MVAVVLVPLCAGAVGGPLSSRFYDKACPNLQSIVRSVMVQAVAAEPRMGASILRMFFHDCFVNVRHCCCHFVSCNVCSYSLWLLI